MFFSDMNILVAREQQRDQLQEAAHERLIQEIQQSNQQQPVQNISGWIDTLLLKSNPKHPSHLDWEKSQTI